jgi:AcrR family transcriptional regulator
LGPQFALGNMTKAVAVQQATSAERILSTALDLFAVKGYDATAVREICEAAGITKPTLYHFFGSKDGVFQALVGNGFLQFRQLVDAALAPPGSFRQRVKTLTRSVFQNASKKPVFWRFMHSVIWAPPGTALPQTESCTQFYDGVVGALAQAAEEAVEQGEIASGPTDVRMLILMGAIGEAATGYVIAGKPELTPELADQIVDTIFDGWK